LISQKWPIHRLPFLQILTANWNKLSHRSLQKVGQKLFCFYKILRIFKNWKICTPHAKVI
jgi:hypothetical protein